MFARLLQTLNKAVATTKTSASAAIALEELHVEASPTQCIVRGGFDITLPVAFNPRLDLDLRAASGEGFRFTSNETCAIGWLPRGRYAFTVVLPANLPAEACTLTVSASHQQAMSEVMSDRRERSVALCAVACAPQSATWSFEAVAPTPRIDALAWKKGHSDWFFRHFDHAATTAISYLLGDSPLLRKRILDVGCGDGITDLGVALRTQCDQFVGVDPYRQFERLPAIIAGNHLPADAVPPMLSFMAADANFLPFPDDSFEVVISWGSVEHIAGGYLQALREVKRVLVPDGLFLVAPGLYYSNIGHHLDEFSTEPFFHLKKPHEEIRRLVLETPPTYIDRSGEFATNEQYWQWHCELNRITVTEFEKELRALQFEPWRVALRTIPLVEYTPELQQYSIEQLANTELYMSCYNRKRARP
ncbi:MAG TPA: class I SAM-dependent methyltransferase [Casimicrobiaceae bacterium]|nr:class I SAM-dependent methyltransferase [Casimicrobiaceae bacterium]